MSGLVYLLRGQSNQWCSNTGGPALYNSTRPFFLGLIMGQIFVSGMWLIIDYFTGMVGNQPIGGSFV